MFVRAPSYLFLWMIEEAGLTIIFYHDGNILEAAASAIAGEKSRFWLELGMKWNRYFIQNLIMYSMCLLCWESHPLSQLLYLLQFSKRRLVL
jgi:hypothetical protein